MSYFIIYSSQIHRLLSLCVISFLLLLNPFISALYAQDESTVRPIIEEADLKKLAKAEDYKVDADKLIEEANKLNMEVFTVQANPDLDEKAINKKTAQLESQAQQKQVEASALYEKSNELKFGLYKQYLDAYWKVHAGEESNYLNEKLLEEQASDNYFQAASYRIEAKRMDAGYAKVEKLTEANMLESQAIQKQVRLLGIYHGLGEQVSEEPAPEENIQVPAAEEAVTESPEQAVTESPETVPVPYTPTTNTPSEKAQPGQIEINQSMVDAYNRYIASGKFTDTTLSTGTLKGITTFDTERMLQAWYEYIYGRDFVEDEVVTAATDVPEDAAVTDRPVEQVRPEPSDGAEIGIVTDENRGTLVPSDEDVIYRVQLAANRSELSQRALSKMYYGNKNVEMINEDGWYKYSVGDFATYDEASRFRKASGISNAFVVAYRKGTRFLTGTTKTDGDEQPVFTESKEGIPSGLIFRIQVAASRVPLTMGQLKRIYQGTYPVEMMVEDGWYKYQFLGVRLYSDAIQIIRTVTANGAFIVAYEDGTRINLADAVRKNKELESLIRSRGRKGQIQEIEFHLQLAASKQAMPSDELRSLYTGPEPVSVIYDDGWYKYHLKSGNSHEKAVQLKQACGIAGAFIVPYRRAEKIEYYEAIRELK